MKVSISYKVAQDNAVQNLKNGKGGLWLSWCFLGSGSWCYLGSLWLAALRSLNEVPLWYSKPGYEDHIQCAAELWIALWSEFHVQNCGCCRVAEGCNGGGHSSLHKLEAQSEWPCWHMGWKKKWEKGFTVFGIVASTGMVSLNWKRLHCNGLIQYFIFEYLNIQKNPNFFSSIMKLRETLPARHWPDLELA